MDIKTLKDYCVVSALVDSYNMEIQEAEEEGTLYRRSAWSSPEMLKECDDRITRCRNRIEDLKKQQHDVLAWLDTIEDEQIRTAIRLRYIDGLTWKEVNDRVTHGCIPVRSLSDMVNKYIHRKAS